MVNVRAAHWGHGVLAFLLVSLPNILQSQAYCGRRYKSKQTEKTLWLCSCLLSALKCSMDTVETIPEKGVGTLRRNLIFHSGMLYVRTHQTVQSCGCLVSRYQNLVLKTRPKGILTCSKKKKKGRKRESRFTLKMSLLHLVAITARIVIRETNYKW